MQHRKHIFTHPDMLGLLGHAALLRCHDSCMGTSSEHLLALAISVAGRMVGGAALDTLKQAQQQLGLATDRSPSLLEAAQTSSDNASVRQGPHPGAVCSCASLCVWRADPCSRASRCLRTMSPAGCHCRCCTHCGWQYR